MKLFLEPIDVQVRDDLPAALEWRGCAYRVEEILQEWTWRGRWWTDALLRGESRHYYRVTCAATAHAARARRPTPSPACFDIYERSGRWMLSRVLD